MEARTRKDMEFGQSRKGCLEHRDGFVAENFQIGETEASCQRLFRLWVVGLLPGGLIPSDPRWRSSSPARPPPRHQPLASARIDSLPTRQSLVYQPSPQPRVCPVGAPELEEAR